MTTDQNKNNDEFQIVVKKVEEMEAEIKSLTAKNVQQQNEIHRKDGTMH
jgi:hypothetical protein